MLADLFIGIFLSIFLGALVGAQREMKQQKEHYQDFAGFRTFTFICLFAFLVGFLSFEVLESQILILIGVLGIFVLSALSYYALSKKFGKYVSMTTQITALLTFLIGILVSLKYYHVSIIVSVVVVSLLVLGDSLHKFAKRLTNNEVFATLQFAIVALVILPVLPNKNYGPLDVPILNEALLQWFSEDILLRFTVFNFYHIWLMVVLISGITYVGYILMKVVGHKKGILLTGFLGGLMSSTALTSSFSIDSKKWKGLSSHLAVGVILASSIMFFRIIFEVFIVNPGMVKEVIFLSVMGMGGIALALVFYGNRRVVKEKQKYEARSPFALGPALKFGLFFVFVIFISELLTIFFGDKGIYIVAFFSGFVDVDVVTLTFSRLALEGNISEMTASTGIFIAAVANTLFKGGIAYFIGSKDLSKKVLISFAVIITLGLVALALLQV